VVRFSIVTISFNQGEYLERAILSVLGQDQDGLEYIVVDPGSRDGSRAIIERYRSRVSRVIYEPDNGPAEGLNKGFAPATGDIFGYLNADDALLPGVLAKVDALFESMPDIDIIFGHGYLVDNDCRLVKRFYSDPFSTWRYAHGACFVSQPSTFFRANAFRHVGGFNPNNRTCWDGELLLDFALAGKRMKIINDFWSIATVHRDSIAGGLLSATARGHSLRTEFHDTMQEMYKKALGVPPSRLRVLTDIVAKAAKYGRNPIGTAWRIAEKLGIAGVGRRFDYPAHLLRTGEPEFLMP
jgi:glycosyltransferase involved in cell wall biosynthesis